MDAGVIGGIHRPSFGKAATRHDASGWHGAAPVRVSRQGAAGTVELRKGEEIMCMV